MSDPVHSRRTRSPITAEGQLELSLEAVTLPQPGPEELVVRIEAAPIYPQLAG